MNHKRFSKTKEFRAKWMQIYSIEDMDGLNWNGIFVNRNNPYTFCEPSPAMEMWTVWRVNPNTTGNDFYELFVSGTDVLTKF